MFKLISTLILARFVIHTNFCDVRHLLTAFKQKSELLRRHSRYAMDGGRHWCFAAYQLNPILAVPVLKAIIPNAAFWVALLSYGLYKRGCVEALLLFKIHF